MDKVYQLLDELNERMYDEKVMFTRIPDTASSGMVTAYLAQAVLCQGVIDFLDEWKLINLDSTKGIPTTVSGNGDVIDYM